MAEASSASATKSDEEKIEMLDQLLTRLALCNDSSLQPLLSKLLPFTISAPSSQSSAVRNKNLNKTEEAIKAKIGAEAAAKLCSEAIYFIGVGTLLLDNGRVLRCWSFPSMISLGYVRKEI
ncbi:uncharacterized protein LOC125470903 isoform X2 [Pyrus x bretschneideri]|uniref:uncharacterized protein LOC125470903 isoform X2 n=1 Tax=Pyrus x bretschneideri TaxID=225117 RepID=UPI002030D171|nr:uncharacterized protein LOC125470903 isoform X2 [Pyrus x bretschneideri]